VFLLGCQKLETDVSTVFGARRQCHGVDGVGPGGFFLAARNQRHAFRNGSDRTARALILSAPSCGLDRMFAELDGATKHGKPRNALADTTVRYGVIEPSAVDARG
jgi:hypothetical protein